MTENIIQSPLFEKIKNYLNQANSNQQIFLYVPYIKTKILDKLLKDIPNQVSIITTWDTRDLISGSSELKLYRWCKDNRKSLYIHDKIHLKVYSVNLDSAIVTSGNISHRGLEQGGNYEAGVFVEKLTNQDRMYLEIIKREAHFIDDDVYQQYSENYEKWEKETPEKIEYEQPEIKPKKDYFLRSALPMTRNLEELIEGYVKINSNLEPSDNPETSACIYHDLANYEIELGLSKEELIEKLKIRFFAHPFIQKIEEFISPEAYWGRIRIWIRDHCTDVPLPRPWELTENVQTLYDWFVKLGEGRFEVDVPGRRSERIRKITNESVSNSQSQKELENKILEIIASPGHTISEIEKEYAKIEHKKTNLDEPSNSSELENKSKPIWHYKIELNKKIEEIESQNRNLDEYEKKKIHKDIAYVIGRLEKDGILSFWIHKSKQYSPGIWRLTEKTNNEFKNNN